MPRKKTAKHANAKRQTKNNAFANMQKMEKELLEAPAKLAASLNKEINALKQKENKLKNAVNKVKSQWKNAEGRVKAASKANNTSAGKKQLVAAKKELNDAIKAHASFSKELDEASKSLEISSSQQAKWIALGKYLSQFSKEWAKTEKQAQAKAKAQAKAQAAKAKAKSNAKKAKAKTEPVLTIVEQPQIIETMIEDMRQDETAEVIS